MKSPTFFVALLFFGFLTPFFAVFSETQTGISVTPVFQEIALDGTVGTDKSFTVSVTNHTDVVTTLRLSALDFGSLDESGGVAFLGASRELEEKYSLASFMRLEKDALALGPDETQSVKVTIENRESLSPGGHYAALVFKAESRPRDSENSIGIDQIFSVLVFVKKTGGEQYGLSLSEIQWPHSLFSLGTKVTPRFKNTGNVHVVPRGVLAMIDPVGREVFRGALNEESGLLLPESFRIFPIKLVPVKPVFIPGRYRLTFGYRYEGQEEFVFVNERFTFIPLPAMLILLLLFVGGGWYVAKRPKNTGESASSQTAM